MNDEPTELARLYRPVPSSFFPQHGIIASLDRKNNIVFFDRDVFDQLDVYQQRRVLQLDDPFLELTYN